MLDIKELMSMTYTFNIEDDGALWYLSEDEEHEGFATFTDSERDVLSYNLTKLKVALNKATRHDR